MSATLGRLSQLEYSTDGGTTYVKLVTLTEATRSAEVSSAEYSDHSGPDRKHKPDRRGATIDFTVNFDETQASVTGLLGLHEDMTTAKWRFRMEEAAGKQQWVQDGFITTMNPAPGNEDVAQMSGTIQMTGAATRTAQSA